VSNYRRITELPQENKQYLSSGLWASSCQEMFSPMYMILSIPWNEFNINTSQCTDMNRMFNSCGDLTSLDLSTMNTSKVTNMSSMFSSCHDLTSLNLSNFDTRQLQNASNMFNYCEKLTTINLSGWDTSNIVNFGSMFYYCLSLQEIICPDGFDMSSCHRTYGISNMFQGCNPSYNGEPLHFKNVPQNVTVTDSKGIEGVHYVIDSYKN